MQAIYAAIQFCPEEIVVDLTRPDRGKYALKPRRGNNGITPFSVFLNCLRAPERVSRVIGPDSRRIDGAAGFADRPGSRTRLQIRIDAWRLVPRSSRD
jgi:hypothetical protein